MPEQNICPACNGGGKVDSRDGKSWSAITARRNPEVISGALTPKPCYGCKGSGKVASEMTEEQRQTAAVAGLDMRQISAINLPSAAPMLPLAQTPASGQPGASAGQSKKGGK